MRRFISTIRIAACRLIRTRSAIIALALLAFPAPAGAQFLGIDLSPAGLISGAFRALANIFSFLIGIAYMIASYLVQFMLTLNYDILSSNNAVVDVGWRIVRDVANLGFVIVIIAVAVATMLRLESYGAKKLLVRLITAAIIVNFSLAIAGVVIDFSHVITRFFLEDGLGASNAIQLMDSVGGAFNPQRFMLETPDPAPPDPSEQTGFFTTFSTAVLVGLAGLGFSIIFMLIATLVVGALALMLLIRYVALSFLLVLAPLAWLFWVIPALQGQFHKWWSKFLEWTFFAPAVSFFIYLAIAAAKALGEEPLAAIPGLDGVLESVISQGAQMVVLSGIMIGGLIVAQNMGIAGAKGAMGLATRAQKGAQAWAGKQAARMGTRPLRGEGGRKVTEWMQKTPGLRTAGSFLANQRLKFEKKTADEAKKKLPKDLKQQALQYGALTTSNAGKVQIMDNLAKDRDKRKKKFDAEGRKVDAKDAQVKNLEDQRNEARGRGDVETANKFSAEIDRAQGELLELTKEGGAYAKAKQAMDEINDAIWSLPEKAREEIERSGYQVKNTKLGGLYGKRDTVMPTEGDADKVLEAAKKAYEETSGGGGEVKPPSEGGGGGKKK